MNEESEFRQIRKYNARLVAPLFHGCQARIGASFMLLKGHHGATRNVGQGLVNIGLGPSQIAASPGRVRQSARQ